MRGGVGGRGGEGERIKTFGSIYGLVEEQLIV